MDIDPKPFTFEEDFNIIPMRQGSFMIEQGLNFSQAFSNIDEVVKFLIDQKSVYLSQRMHGRGGGSSYDGGYSTYVRPEDEEVHKRLYPNDYEPFDQTGLPKKEPNQEIPGYAPKTEDDGSWKK